MKKRGIMSQPTWLIAIDPKSGTDFILHNTKPVFVVEVLETENGEAIELSPESIQWHSQVPGEEEVKKLIDQAGEAYMDYLDELDKVADD